MLSLTSVEKNAILYVPSRNWPPFSEKLSNSEGIKLGYSFQTNLQIRSLIIPANAATGLLFFHFHFHFPPPSGLSLHTYVPFRVPPLNPPYSSIFVFFSSSSVSPSSSRLWCFSHFFTPTSLDSWGAHKQASAGKYQLQQEKTQQALDKAQSDFDRLQEKLERASNETRRVSPSILF